jgi:Rps23 Pro-64 3,4-dihydroxylase Tpa1-like proline 4-hydroxylase
MINNPVSQKINFRKLASNWGKKPPFNHIVIDDFLEKKLARNLEAEYPAWDDKMWYQYDNQIEQKKALNHWDRFPATTYHVMSFFNSPEFIKNLELMTGIRGLQIDPGLHGGGWHGHTAGGKLNVHLDYSIHPKLGLERRLNLILYITSGWKSEWGGQLGLWAGSRDKMGKLGAQVDCLFNRAVLFDTTQNSWHGLPDAIRCPRGVIRKSLAVYYLTAPRSGAAERGKALFAPHGEQKNDPAILELIKKRSQVATAEKVYRKYPRKT